MNLLRYSCLAVAVAASLAGPASGQYFGGWGFGQGDSRSTLAIRPDGSCVLTNEAVQPRPSLEAQAAAWERQSKMAEGPDSEEENAPPAPPPAAKAEPKKLTDEQLAAKLREMYQQANGVGDNARLEVEKLELTTNSVRVVTRRTFASLKELLSQHASSWEPTLLMSENVRFETDTNRNLRITFMPSGDAARYSKQMGRGWKAARMKLEWKLALPGKILSSGFPNTEGNETWLRLDGEKPETVEAMLKLVEAPLVITAELAGLKLDEPLESRKLFRAARRQSGAEPDLPITDAGPGFQAEPMSLTISTVHYFPGAKEHLKGRPEAAMFGSESAGLVVGAKLFPPKGRVIRSVSGLRVKAAKDDKGRGISGTADGGDDAVSFSEFSYGSDDQEKGGTARVQLHLGLPAPDAKTVDQLEAEAVVLSIGGWKELVLTNVQADAKKEIDLGEVLPGAKLIVKKISGKKPQTMLELRLEGPAAVNQLAAKIKMSSRRGGSSNISNQQTATSGNKTTRNLTLHAFEFEPGETGKSSPPTLLIRYPQDMKRERVQFKLTTLDLL